MAAKKKDRFHARRSQGIPGWLVFDRVEIYAVAACQEGRDTANEANARLITALLNEQDQRDLGKV